jgi:TonB family protein
LFEFAIPAGSVPRSPRPVAASIAVHGLVLLLLLTLRFAGKESSFPVAAQHFTLLAPVTESPLLPPKVRAPRPEQFHPLRASLPATPSLAIPAVPARVDLPPAPPIPTPAIEISKPMVVESLKLQGTPAAIKASGFTEAKAAAPVLAPKPVVKVSGFQSAESSAAGPPRGTLSPVTAGAGSFDSASSAGAPVRSGAAIGRPGGFSDASASGASGTHRGSITNGAFGDTTLDKGARQRSPTQTAAAPFTPVEVISKPKPTYTDDARTQKIEGEVLLDMQFSASGEARVLRIVRGLGHGLDESALTAARGIRFHPATRNGVAVDSAAIVHIVFQLAE